VPLGTILSWRCNTFTNNAIKNDTVPFYSLATSILIIISTVDNSVIVGPEVVVDDIVVIVCSLQALG
jgi:hypothetical protein